MEIDIIQWIVVIGAMVVAGTVCVAAWHVLRRNLYDQPEIVDQWAPIDMARIMDADKKHPTGS